MRSNCLSQSGKNFIQPYMPEDYILRVLRTSDRGALCVLSFALHWKFGANRGSDICSTAMRCSFRAQSLRYANGDRIRLHGGMLSG